MGMIASAGRAQPMIYEPRDRAARPDTRMIDGMPSANDSGLTKVAPSMTTVRAGTMSRSIQLGNMVIMSKSTAASKPF
jgi:hypothetical protein